MNLYVSGFVPGTRKDREKPIIHDVNFSLPTEDILRTCRRQWDNEVYTLQGLMDAITHGRVTYLVSNSFCLRKQGKIAYVPQTEAIDATFPLLVKDVVMREDTFIRVGAHTFRSGQRAVSF